MLRAEPRSSVRAEIPHNSYGIPLGTVPSFPPRIITVSFYVKSEKEKLRFFLFNFLIRVKRKFDVSANGNTSCDTVIYINVLERAEAHGGENAQPLREAAARSCCSWFWPHISSFWSQSSLENLNCRETEEVTGDDWASPACRRPGKGAGRTSKSESLPGTLGVSLEVSCMMIIRKTLPTLLQHEGEQGATRCVLNVT